MKNLLIRFLQFLFSSPQFSMKLKDTALLNAAEHLFRTQAYIEQHDLRDFGKTIIDIGAAQGDTAIWFAQVFPRHHVHAFEPVKTSFDKALKKTGKFSNITLHNVALTNEKGETTVHVSDDVFSSSIIPINPSEIKTKDPALAARLKTKSSHKIAMQPLDETEGLHGSVLLMKIDTQGSELAVLKGAVKTLSRTRLVLVEMNNHELYEGSARYHQVDEFLRQNHFKLRDIYVTYRPKGEMSEYDALYENLLL